MHVDLVGIIFLFKTNDSLLCPVKSCAITTTRLKNTVLGANGDTKVWYIYIYEGTVRELDSI